MYGQPKSHHVQLDYDKGRHREVLEWIKEHNLSFLDTVPGIYGANYCFSNELDVIQFILRWK